MDAIFKNENVYVVVKNEDLREGVELCESKDLILCSQEDIRRNYLYGGRVELKLYSSEMCIINIDGIPLHGLESYSNNYGDLFLKLVDKFSLEQAAAYLNQLENLGVDSFLENYKLQIQEIKRELESKADTLQHELAIEQDNYKAGLLNSIKKVLLRLTILIFSLLVNMNAGLENHQYTEAYDQIINLYF